MFLGVLCVPSASFSRCLTLCNSFIWSACNVTLTRLIMNLRRAAIEAEESFSTDAYIHSRGWPLLPRQGSCVSEAYELQGKGPEICARLSPSVTSITM
jgi:hypothetical protein